MRYCYRIAIAGLLFLAVSAVDAHATTYYKRDTNPTNNNWNQNDNWSTVSSASSTNTGTFPIAGDTALFDAGSIQCTINTASAVAILDATGYTNTLTQSANFTTTSTVTLVAGMTFTYTSGTWTHNGTATITTGGKAFGAVTFNSAAATVTLADDMNVDGTLTISAATTVNGGAGIDILASGSVTVNAALSGTTTLVFDGTGTWSGGANKVLSLNTTINTAGTITCSGDFHYNTGTLTYTAGTMSMGTSRIIFWGSCTLNTSGMSWYSFYVYQAATITLTSDLNVDGIFTNAAVSTFNGAFNVKPSLTFTVSSNMSGTASIVLDGTGTWSGAGQIANNLTINSAGTVTASGTIYYKTGTLTVTSGLSSGTSTLTLPNTCTLTGGTWNNVSTTTAGTCTLGAALDVNGVLNIGASTILDCAGYQLNVAGNFTRTGTFTHGNNTTVFDGTSTIAGAATFYNLTLATGSTTHLTSTQTFTVSGTFNATGAGITLDAVTGGSRALLPVTTLGTVDHVTATDIDSSGGVAIVNTSGTLSNTVNWTTPPAIPKTQVYIIDL